MALSWLQAFPSPEESSSAHGPAGGDGDNVDGDDGDSDDGDDVDGDNGGDTDWFHWNKDGPETPDSIGTQEEGWVGTVDGLDIKGERSCFPTLYKSPAGDLGGRSRPRARKPRKRSDHQVVSVVFVQCSGTRDVYRDAP